MFKVPVVKHGVNGHLRQKGKIAELACGYGGGVGALKAFGADKMGLTEEEMQDIVNQWRAASPTIPRLWRRVEDAAKAALETPGRRCAVMRKQRDPARAALNEALTGGHGYSQDFLAGGSVCTYWKDKDALRCKLPSGRILTYWDARLVDGHIEFMGQNQTTRKWERTETWGGKLVENIVQAFARDCLAVAMVRLDEAGYAITFHVHDEIIAEAPDGSRWEDMAEIMGRPIDWAPGLLLRGDGYATKFYMKD
jgi:DNA polymerase